MKFRVVYWLNPEGSVETDPFDVADKEIAIQVAEAGAKSYRAEPALVIGLDDDGGEICRLYADDNNAYTRLYKS